MCVGFCGAPSERIQGRFSALSLSPRSRPCFVRHTRERELNNHAPRDPFINVQHLRKATGAHPLCSLQLSTQEHSIAMQERADVRKSLVCFAPSHLHHCSSLHGRYLHLTPVDSLFSNCLCWHVWGNDCSDPLCSLACLQMTPC